MGLLYLFYPTRATYAAILFSLVLIAVMLRRAVLSESGTMWSSHRARAVESAHERRSCRSLSLSEYPLQAVAYRGVSTPPVRHCPPEIPKAPQNRAKLNPIVKTFKSR